MVILSFIKSYLFNLSPKDEANGLAYLMQTISKGQVALCFSSLKGTEAVKVARMAGKCNRSFFHFFIPGNSTASNHVKKTFTAKNVEFYNNEMVLVNLPLPVNYVYIKKPGHELELISDLQEYLKLYKPTIVVEADETTRGRLYLLNLFKLLKQLKYSGFFILDQIHIPIQNFDFDVYQNPRSNFYCNTFIFE
jgi:hypothetical protein